tara:strand:+ start:3562 stop:3828 length:267 start_codon:yes stop_codon:yes gene_type:complete
MGSLFGSRPRRPQRNLVAEQALKRDEARVAAEEREAKAAIAASQNARRGGLSLLMQPGIDDMAQLYSSERQTNTQTNLGYGRNPRVNA